MGRFSKGEISGAINSLQRNRGRSFLTMLGIVIGVSSVVLVVGIGQGVKDQVNDQTEQLGRDLITIRPGSLPTSNNNVLDTWNQLTTPGAAGSLSAHDIGVVEKTAGVASAVPLAAVSGGAVSGETHKKIDVLVVG